jgi:hypothetical protein
MRPVIIVIALSAVVLSPGLGFAEKAERAYTNKQMCRRMTRQIAHFEGTVLPMAKGRGNALWADSTNAHIDRLKNHRADVCPEWGKQRKALIKAKKEWDQMKAYAKIAAKYALKYFTGAWF